MLMAGLKTKHKIKQYMEIGRELLGSLLFPSRCPVCDEILEPEEIEKGIHFTCESKLYPVLGAVCMHCGRPLGDENPNISTREYCYDCIQKGYNKHSYIVQAKAEYLYKGMIKKTMYRFKYSNKREYAHFFAKQALEKYGTWLHHTGVEVIVPVPLYPKKQRRRGYNQAESFAEALSKQTGIPVEKTMVQRRKDTIPQKGLNALQRKNNLKNAFHCQKNVVQYKCVLVVDDIYTTGSTAEAVARELMKKGACRIYLMTICIGEDK